MGQLKSMQEYCERLRKHNQTLRKNAMTAIAQRDMLVMHPESEVSERIREMVQEHYAKLKEDEPDNIGQETEVSNE